ncbi:NADP-dependent oxidoreductase [Dactylosporangium sp. NPDC049140]|uniref:NADP-dependent oxidoreductase n=1 Tax=Dactylosporangium sp. NPDC049140 TaxID=3155647 RepID=UPI0033E4F2B5
MHPSDWTGRARQFVRPLDALLRSCANELRSYAQGIGRSLALGLAREGAEHQVRHNQVAVRELMPPSAGRDAAEGAEAERKDENMKAVAVNSFGDPPRVLDLPEPEPGPGEILVGLQFASINPVDWAATAGALTRFTKHRFPLILGFDGVGRIQALGAGVQRFAVGDLIHGQFWGDVLAFGTYAQRLTIVEQPAFGALQTVPDGVDPRLAAALPTAGMTADGALEQLGCQAGQSLLILGATGGVGVLATQLAAQTGLTVIATARADAREQIQRLGAAETIDYGTHTVDDELTTVAPGGVHGVLDLVGDPEGLAAAVRHLRDGGRVVSIASGVTDELAAQKRIIAINYVLDDKPARLRRVSERLAAGRLEVPVDREVALQQAPEAVAAARQGGARGKTLIRI